MNRNLTIQFILRLSLIIMSLVGSVGILNSEWGFYGHKKINYYSVFLLPEEMIPLFKTNIFFLSEQATSPDSRRYAIPAEGPKHYIDTEDYLEGDYHALPTNIIEALIRYSKWTVNGYPVTVKFDNNKMQVTSEIYITEWSINQVENLYFYHLLPQYLEEEAKFTLQDLFPDSTLTHNLEFVVDETLSEKGINPYHLEFMRKRLTTAFIDKDYEKILRLSAEIGHYVADICVPLHTTKNYNGQLTNQLGIHAFWESRIPELLAEDEWDFYFDDVWRIDQNNYLTYFIHLSESSYSLVLDVLEAERKARAHMSDDQIWCFEERNDLLIRTQCEKYARTFDMNMKDMVQKQFRQSIHSVASVWYSCWVDAGSPSLESYAHHPKMTSFILQRAVQEKSRIHEN